MLFRSANGGTNNMWGGLVIDNTDNRFNPPVGRFPAIEEDEPPYRLLCNEYPDAI